MLFAHSDYTSVCSDDEQNEVRGTRGKGTDGRLEVSAEGVSFEQAW